jgi:hypothetical protein
MNPTVIADLIQERPDLRYYCNHPEPAQGAHIGGYPRGFAAATRPRTVIGIRP